MPVTRRVAALAAATVVTSASADTLTVCASGCDFTSINAAIAAASDGDVIQLSAETYLEGASIDPLGKAITIRGTLDKSGSPSSVLDGGNSPGGTSGIRVVICRSGETSATRFENLVIRNGFAVGTFTGINGGAGMYNGAGSDPTVTNCIFEGNYAVYSGGGMYNRDSSPTVIDCVFRDNAGLYGGGMLNASSSPVISGCEFSGNASGLGGGLLNTESSPIVTDSRFCGNTAQGILSVESQIYGDPIEGEQAGNCVAVSCAECDPDFCGDIDGDHLVDSSDLGLLIGGWGTADPTLDLSGDGIVDSADLGLLIGSWGTCS